MRLGRLLVYVVHKHGHGFGVEWWHPMRGFRQPVSFIRLYVQRARGDQ